MSTWLLIGDGYVRSDQIESLTANVADSPDTIVRLISGSVWVMHGMTPRQTLNWIRAAESGNTWGDCAAQQPGNSSHDSV